MVPLKITAVLSGRVSFRDYIHLDALLAWAVALRDNLMATNENEIIDIDIPVEKEPGGRFHLSSVGLCDWEYRERAYLIRRFPIELAVHHTKIRSVNLAAGAQKHHRIMYERGALVGDTIVFYCVGDKAEVAKLISLVSHIGARRAAGNGRVKHWDISECEPWEGFPILSPGGMPLRNLPHEHEGVSENAEVRYGNVTYPYWRRSTEELIHCPDRYGSSEYVQELLLSTIDSMVEVDEAC